MSPRFGGIPSGRATTTNVCGHRTSSAISSPLSGSGTRSSSVEPEIAATRPAMARTGRSACPTAAQIASASIAPTAGTMIHRARDAASTPARVSAIEASAICCNRASLLDSLSGTADDNPDDSAALFPSMCPLLSDCSFPSPLADPSPLAACDAVSSAPSSATRALFSKSRSTSTTMSTDAAANTSTVASDAASVVRDLTERGHRPLTSPPPRCDTPRLAG